jgi:hypothetical protein
MPIPVKLSEVVDEMSMSGDEISTYLNRLVPFSRRSVQEDRPRLAARPRHPLCRVSRGRLTTNATRPAPQHLQVDSPRCHDGLSKRVLGFQRRRAVKRSVLGTCAVAALIRGVQPIVGKGISMKLKHVVIKWI